MSDTLVVTGPRFIEASASAPKYVQTTAGSLLDYATASTVSSVSNDGTLDPTGASGATGTTFRSSVWVRSRLSTVISISDASTEKREAFLSIVAPSGGLFSTDTLTVENDVPYFTRIVPSKQATISSVGFTVVEADGGSEDAWEVGLFAKDGTMLSSTGNIALVDNNTVTADLAEPVTFQAGVPYFVGLKFHPTEARSTLTTSLTGANNDVTFTAVPEGAAGDAITICYLDPGGNDQGLDSTLSLSDITILLATGPAGAITTTANDLLSFVNAAFPTFVAGVTAPGNNGTGVVTAMGATHLAGGGAETSLEVPAAVYPDVAVTQAFGNTAEDVLQAVGTESASVFNLGDWGWDDAVVSAPLVYLFES